MATPCVKTPFEIEIKTPKNYNCIKNNSNLIIFKIPSNLSKQKLKKNKLKFKNKNSH